MKIAHKLTKSKKYFLVHDKKINYLCAIKEVVSDCQEVELPESVINKYDDIKFCGFDAGTKQIEWMKATTGAKLIGAVAQDSYQIGYNAVEQCINAIEGKEVKDNVAIAGAWWDASNVDDMISKNLVYEG